MRKFSGKLLIFTGIACLLTAGYFLFQRVNPNRLKFEGYIPEAEVSTDKPVGVPKHLIIKELGVNLEVVPANVINDRWETTYDGVSYLASSPVPGTVGNSIFYGHNWSSLLGNLKNASPGQIIEIIDDAGRVTRFEVNFVQVVGPDEKSILDQTSDNRLTLYTCTGFLDTKRLVVTAIKIN